MSNTRFTLPIVASIALLAVMVGGYFVGRAGSLAHKNTEVLSKAEPSTRAARSLWTCAMHPQVIQDKPGLCPICHMELVPIKSTGQGHDGAILIDPAIVQNMGVRTSVVSKGPLVRSVRVVGYLEEPEPLHRDINLRVNGWIEKLYADTDGMAVTKGIPLFDLYSPELTVAIDELISARKQSAGDATAHSLFDSSRRKLLQFGLEESQVDQLAALDSAPRTVPVLSSIDGHLTAKMVYEGTAVKSGDLVMRLAARHHMWIDAQVYEQQMSLISDGQPARITLVSQPGKVIEGKVLFVHPHVDPRTRTALARIEIPNQDLSLRQGMYATVDILADSYAEVTVLPREAVIDSGRKQVAFVSLGDGKFEPRLLTLGASGQDGTVQVLSGVQPGETVVTSGQFLLDSESRIREALAKFGDTDIAATSQPANSNPVQIVVSKNLVNVPHLDQLVSAYLAIAKTLGEREADGAQPIEVRPLVELSSMAAMHSDATAKPMIERLSWAADAMSGKPLAEQRRAFIDLSSAMIDIVESAPPTQVLYQFHCPMAFHSEGADWLQSGENIANPYYASEMKACGTVERKFQPGKP